MLKSISYFMFGVITAFLLYGAYEGIFSVVLALSVGVAIAIATVCIFNGNDEEES